MEWNIALWDIGLHKEHYESIKTAEKNSIQVDHCNNIFFRIQKIKVISYDVLLSTSEI